MGDGSGLTCNSDSKCREAADEIEGRLTSSKQATVYPSPRDETLAQVQENPQGPRKSGKKVRTKKKGYKKKRKKRKGQL